MSIFKFELGAEATEIVTGFTGIITGRAEYIAGCRQYSITRKVTDGGDIKTEWFDEERLTVNGNKVTIGATNTGGPAGSDCAPIR